MNFRKLLKKATVKEYKNLDFYKVQEFCIDNELYTQGTQDDFDKLNAFISNKIHFSKNDLLKIAIDIYNHSDIDNLAYEYGCTNESYFNHILHLVYCASYYTVYATDTIFE